jgi:hypothetical protein
VVIVRAWTARAAAAMKVRVFIWFVTFFVRCLAPEFLSCHQFKRFPPPNTPRILKIFSRIKKQ